MALVTEEYRKQLQQMHKPNPETGRTWGATACRHVYTIFNFINDTDMPYETILDYGSADGKFQFQARRRGLVGEGVEIYEYDPGIVGKEENNIPCDFVMCSDVLEHIEPDLIDAVLDDLQRCTLVRGYFCIALYPADKNLPDGRNAHLIIEKPEWWLDKLRERFTILDDDHATDRLNRSTLNVYVESKR